MTLRSRDRLSSSRSSLHWHLARDGNHRVPQAGRCISSTNGWKNTRKYSCRGFPSLVTMVKLPLVTTVKS
eukprot:52420-Rhodomonas_salina.1